jgi:aldehyde:ferredoxin oxidoreductase
MGTLLRIDMTGLHCTREPCPEKYAGLGGRGLTSSIIAEEVPPLCDPLGADNRLVLAPGLLSGTSAPNAGRLSVGAKSPLTGGIKESNAGGSSAARLARLGLSAVVIEGCPVDTRLHLLVIRKDHADILPADSYAGTGTYALTEALHCRFGDTIAIMCIGPAGEQHLLSASIQVTDLNGKPCRAAGRGGLGAVMASKGLKAIIIDDAEGSSPHLADPDRFAAGRKKVARAISAHPVTGQAMPEYGTAMVVGPINAAGAFPTRNAALGVLDQWERISGDALAELISARGGNPTHAGCSNCIIRCSNVFVDQHKNYVTGSLEYETIWSLGGMCEIPDLDTIALFDRMCDDLGLDTMNTGCAVAVAMEAGLKSFGDRDGALALVAEVGKGSDIGKLIGNGPVAVGERYGVRRIPAVKKQSLAAYDPRAIQGMGVTYATSPMGADHTAGWTVGVNLASMGGKGDALVPDGQVDCSRAIQIGTAAADCTGMCQFTGFPIEEDAAAAEGLLEMLSERTGRQWTSGDLFALGQRVLRTERNFNRAAGLTCQDDRLPDFYRVEPLPPHNTTFLVTDEELDTLFDF